MCMAYAFSQGVLQPEAEAKGGSWSNMKSIAISRKAGFSAYGVFFGAIMPLALTWTAGRVEAASPGEMEAYIAQKMATNQIWGMPYELDGKRMFFTNWYLIHPGNLLWLGEDGELVNTAEEGAEAPKYDAWNVKLDRPSSPYGIEIVVQKADRMGPIIKPEMPWEKEYIIFKTVMKDGDKYRAWGKSRPGGDCYFESGDGLNWTRVILRQKEFEGSLENNLFKVQPEGTVFLDPSAPPEERYKCVRGPTIKFDEFKEFVDKHPDKWESRSVKGYWREPEKFRALAGGVSPDGIVWKYLPEVFTVEHSDGMEVAYYDQHLRKYVIFTRTWLVGPRSSRWQGDAQIRTWFTPEFGTGRRAIGRMESDTFGNFGLSEAVIVPVPNEVSPSECFYTSIWTPIPGAPDQQLMFPAIWDMRDDTCSIGLWSSHDGKIWSRVPGPPVLETAAFGEWDGGCVFTFPYLTELPNGDFVLPYKGYNLPHKYPRGHMTLYAGYMVWPKGRLVAVEAKEIGEFATVGIIPPGRTLKINALTKRAGGILVEIARLNPTPKVLDFTGFEEVIPGRAFADCTAVQGDQFWKTVDWNGETDLGFKEGDCVVIRFKMDRAKLFGIEFE